MSKMFWQADSTEKSVFRLHLKATRLAEFAFINKENGIGKISDAALHKEQIWVFKTSEFSDFKEMKIFNAETKEQFSVIKLDASGNGEIEFSSDLKFKWTQTAWTSFDRAWQDSDGENLSIFELNNWQIAENFVALKMSENAGKVGQIFLLILLGWALIVKEKAKSGAVVLAEGNPQGFLAEDKIREVFGVDLKSDDFNKKFIATSALAGNAASGSGSSVDLEDVADVAGIGFDLLDWF